MARQTIKHKKRTDLKTLDPLYISPECIQCILKAGRIINEEIAKASALIRNAKQKATSCGYGKVIGVHLINKNLYDHR